jgi:hypothetical protein
MGTIPIIIAAGIDFSEIGYAVREFDHWGSSFAYHNCSELKNKKKL